MRKKKIFNITFRILTIILSIVILVFIIYWGGGFKTVWETIKRLSLYIFLVLSVIYSIGWFFRGLRWKIILKNIGTEVSLLNSTELTFIGNTYNLILPAKLGDAARVIGLKKICVSKIEENISSVITDRFLDFVIVVFLTFTSLPFLNIKQISSNIQWLLYVSPVVLLLGVLVYIYVYTKREDSFILKILPKKISSFTSKMMDALAVSVRNKRFILICTSLIIWIIDSTVAFLVYVSIESADISVFIFIVFGIMLGNLTKTIPFTPGGIGTYELVFAAVLSLAGIPIQISVSIALIDHLFKNLFTIFFGIISSLHLGISMKDLRNEQKELSYKSEVELEKIDINN